MHDRKLFWFAVIGAMITMIAASAFSVHILVVRRNDAIDDARRTAGNYASIIAEQVSNAAQAIDISLRDIVERRVETSTAEAFLAQVGTQDFHLQLRDVLTTLPQADVITITDADGKLVANTRAYPYPDVNLADRDHFQRLKADRSDALTVSAPVMNRFTNVWTVYFGRRLQTPDGRFLGMIVVGVRPEIFIQTQHSLTAIEGQTFALLRDDGTFLLRKHDGVDRTGWRISPQSGWYNAVARGGGLYRSPGFFHKIPRHVAVRPLARYPLVVNVGISEEAALAVWWERTVAVVKSIGAALVACSLLLATMIALFRRLELSRAQLAEREARLARQAEELVAVNRRFDAALNNTSHGVAMFDADGGLIVANARLADLYDGKPPAPPAKGDDGATQWLEPLASGRIISVRRRGLPDNAGWVTTHEDVTEQVETMARIEHLAGHDHLTGLVNRAGFIEALQFETARPRQAEHLAVLLLDLDGFKAVNDTFGHSVGDSLLQQAAARLKTASGAGLIARLGGDEFAMIHKWGVAAPASDAEAMAGRLAQAICAPFEIGAARLSVGMSVGIEIVASDDRDLERIMRHADLALYRAKREGRGRYRVFDIAMEEDFQKKAAMVEDLRLAIAAGAIDVHYQPIVSTTDRRIVAMEALARWRHPEHGAVSPGIFVPLAEEAGLIGALGGAVLARACADAARWPDPVRVSVNVSALQIAEGNFVDIARKALADAGLPAHRLEVEITETTLLRREAGNIEALRALRALGLSVALDDFGVGYASLSYLRMFPFDTIKIDKSFVDEVTTHDGCATIIAATTMLARSFDMATTAEGVETVAQLEMLRLAGVTQVQGYHLARPAPFSDWIVADGRILLPDGTGGKEKRAA